MKNILRILVLALLAVGAFFPLSQQRKGTVNASQGPGTSTGGRIIFPASNTITNANPLRIEAEAWSRTNDIQQVTFRAYSCAAWCAWREIGVSNAAPYEILWDWSNLSPQRVRLAVDVTDSSGTVIQAESDEVTVFIDAVSPEVHIAAPASHTSTGIRVVDISTDAGDNETGLNSVQFYAGYSEQSKGYWHAVGADHNGSDGWGMRWDATALANGTRVDLLAVAVGLAGNTAIDQVFSVYLGFRPTSTATRTPTRFPTLLRTPTRVPTFTRTPTRFPTRKPTPCMSVFFPCMYSDEYAYPPP